jgi:hypothetical protein
MTAVLLLPADDTGSKGFHPGRVAGVKGGINGQTWITREGGPWSQNR